MLLQRNVDTIVGERLTFDEVTFFVCDNPSVFRVQRIEIILDFAITGILYLAAQLKGVDGKSIWLQLELGYSLPDTLPHVGHLLT